MTVKQLVKILSKKLTKKEFIALSNMMDADPPAGPLWEAVQEEHEMIAPEDFHGRLSIKDQRKELSEV
jgi:hypothetical protein